MIDYVVGFAINPNTNQIAMIRKNRPSWQAGKYNVSVEKLRKVSGILPLCGREFLEETGYQTTEDAWRNFALIDGYNEASETEFTIQFYVMPFMALSSRKSATDEKVVILNISAITADNSIPDLTWLSPMAKTIMLGQDSIKQFMIMERYSYA